MTRVRVARTADAHLPLSSSTNFRRFRDLNLLSSSHSENFAASVSGGLSAFNIAADLSREGGAALSVFVLAFTIS